MHLKIVILGPAPPPSPCTDKIHKVDFDCQSLHSGLNHLEKRCPVLPKGSVWHSKRNLSSDLSICPRCQIFGGKIGHHLMFGICPTPPLDSLSTNRFFHLATTSWYWTTLLAKMSHFSLYHSRYLQMCLHQWKQSRKTRSEGHASKSVQICTFAPLTTSAGHVNWIFCQFFVNSTSKSHKVCLEGFPILVKIQERSLWPLSPLWRCKRRELDIGISTLSPLPTVRH